MVRRKFSPYLLREGGKGTTRRWRGPPRGGSREWAFAGITASTLGSRAERYALSSTVPLISTHSPLPSVKMNMNREFRAFSHGSKVHTKFKFKIRYSLVIRAGRREDVSVEGRAADIDDATTVSAEYDRDGIAKLGKSAVFGVQGHPIVVRWCRRKFRHQGT